MSVKTEIQGREHWRDARGAWVPLSLIRPMDQLIDGCVEKIMQYAGELSEQIERFRGHTFDDLGSLQALIEQEYNANIGGRKGNVTLTSFDGCQRVTLQQQDQFDFGPELQAAKQLVDECLSEWSQDARIELRALVANAFQARDGKINRGEIFRLLRFEIDDARWERAMKALRDSIRVIGSKAYLQFHVRDRPDGAWRAVTINLAKTGA